MIPTLRVIPVSQGDTDSLDVDFASSLVEWSTELGVVVEIASVLCVSSDPTIVEVLQAPAVVSDELGRVRLWWRATGRPTNEATITTTVVSSSGHVRSQSVRVRIVLP